MAALLVEIFLRPDPLGMSLLLTSPAYLLALPVLLRLWRRRIVAGSALAVLAITVAALIIHDTAEARIGGGKSLGAQRPSVMPRASAPPATTPPGAASQPVMPAQPGATLPGTVIERCPGCA